MERCFLTRHVIFLHVDSYSPANGLPLGVTGELDVVYTDGGPGPNGGPTSKIDGGWVTFFKPPALAQVGQTKLANKYSYFVGIPDAELKLLNGHRPSKAVGRRLERVTGNAVIIWTYPRHRIDPSNALMASCLTEARK